MTTFADAHQDKAPHMVRVAVVLLAIVLSAVASATGEPAADVKGSRDHPMVSRIPGSAIIAFDQKDFDEYKVVTGPVSGLKADGTRWPDQSMLSDRNTIPVEGRVTKIAYQTPHGKSTLEIIRSFQSALTTAGFEVLYKCTNLECSGPQPPQASPAFDLSSEWRDAFTHVQINRVGLRVTDGVAGDRRYLAARLRRSEGDVYVAAFAIGLAAPLARIDVIEVQPQATSLVNVSAVAMAATMATRGSVALYGIYFDNDQAAVKPASKPTLSEIAKLLKDNGKLDVIVVGHTDHVGTFEHNSDLSMRRAQAVVEALASQYGIARSRLEARGVGFLAPVAPNSSDENRAKNRRVELLER